MVIRINKQLFIFSYRYCDASASKFLENIEVIFLCFTSLALLLQVFMFTKIQYFFRREILIIFVYIIICHTDTYYASNRNNLTNADLRHRKDVAEALQKVKTTMIYLKRTRQYIWNKNCETMMNSAMDR